MRIPASLEHDRLNVDDRSVDLEFATGDRWTSRFTRDARSRWDGGNVLTDNHFARREADRIVVDLLWDRGVGVLNDAFRVLVEDRRDGARFVLYPTTGREAIQAFHHPFSAASTAVDGGRRGSPAAGTRSQPHTGDNMTDDQSTHAPIYADGGGQGPHRRLDFTTGTATQPDSETKLAPESGRGHGPQRQGSGSRPPASTTGVSERLQRWVAPTPREQWEVTPTRTLQGVGLVCAGVTVLVLFLVAMG